MLGSAVTLENNPGVPPRLDGLALTRLDALESARSSSSVLCCVNRRYLSIGGGASSSLKLSYTSGSRESSILLLSPLSFRLDCRDSARSSSTVPCRYRLSPLFSGDDGGRTPNPERLSNESGSRNSSMFRPLEPLREPRRLPARERDPRRLPRLSPRARLPLSRLCFLRGIMGGGEGLAGGGVGRSGSAS
jgi:hypothetical protein